MTAPLSPIQAGTIAANPLLTSGQPVGGAVETADVDFSKLVSDGVANLQKLQNTADDLAVQAATGTLTDVHDYLIAATQASLATQLTVALRNKALDAFNEIMRMPA